MRKEDGPPADAMRKDASTSDGPVSVRHFFRYATALDVMLMCVGSIASLAVGAAQPAQMIFFGQVLDTVGSPELGGSASAVAARLESTIYQYIYLAIGAFVMGTTANYCWKITGERQGTAYRKAYLRAIMRQDVGWHDVRATNGLAAMFAESTQLVEEGLGVRLAEGIRFLGTGLAGVVVALWFQWDLGLVLLGVAPLAIGSARFLNRINAITSKATQDAYADAGTAAAEVLAAIRTVASFGGEPRERQRFEARLAPAEAAGIGAGWRKGVATGALSVTSLLVIAVGVVYGAQKIAREREETGCLATGTCAVSGGAVLLTMFAMNRGAQSLGFISQTITSFATARAAAGRIDATMRRVPPIDVFATEGLQPDGATMAGRVEFRNVAFRYPSRPEAAIYTDFCLTIEPGTTCALVGGSGSGKSTAVQLLERFYDPEAGAVLLDGVDLRALQLRWLRQHIGLVGQEPTLFEGTVAQNIAYGRPDATAAEIEEAARMANAHAFIEAFPDRYETRVAQGQLSGGQKQRIAIARAILKQPTILLLDEATSALDNESERVVQAALDALLAAQKRTTLVIAHRLSTIRNADKIAFVGEGRVLEEGTHDELMRKGRDGHYARLVQQAGASLGGGGGRGGDAPIGMPVLTMPVLDSPARMRVTTVTIHPDPCAPAAASDLPKTARELERAEKADAKARAKAKAALTKQQRARIWAMQQPERRPLYVSIASALLLGGISPAIGVLLTKLIRVFFYPDPQRVRTEAWQWAGIIIGASLCQLLLEVVRSYGLAVSGERLTRRLREQAFAAMVRQEMGWHDAATNSAANLTANLARDITLVAAVTGESLGIQLANMATVVVGLGLIFGLGTWQLGLVALCVVPVIGATLALQMRSMRGEGASSRAKTKADVAGIVDDLSPAEQRKQAEAAAKRRADSGAAAREAASSIVGQLSTSVRTVASFGLEHKLFGAYAEAVETAAAAQIRKAYLPALLTGFSQFAITGAMVALYAYGGYLISRGEADFESMFVVILVMFLMANGLGQFSQGATDQALASRAVGRILHMLDRESLLDPTAIVGAAPAREAIRGRVEFRNVAFRYPSRPEAAIYTDFCLTIEPGTTCALVGGSGSGKSTAVQLLERFYDPEAGAVLLDGVDLRALQLRWLRQHIGLVGQEPTLFEGTVAQNIAYGRPDATAAEIEEAARMANAHAFIEAFPDRYETRVGQMGSQLSGGQKQRVAIARAILKQPTILLLDEATSALDNESERVVQAALDALLAAQKRTTLVIAHRLSTIRNADKIAFVGEGRVLEEGTHDELLSRRGAYATLVSATN